MFGFKKKRRLRIRQRLFPPSWLAILKRNMPYYAYLSKSDQEELGGHVQVFLDEKRFEGCGGLEITDEIRVTIAAQACMLLLHRESDYYPTLKSILVYPHAYLAETRHRLSDGTAVVGKTARAGESWFEGSVVLSWDDVRQSAADINDGRNVVFHEFAHQLDSESGANEGAPDLPKGSMYIAWARVLGHEYRRLIDDLEHHRKTLLNGYGATNPAEFFAVVTEAFFERLVALKAMHPALYEEMKLFYQQDTAARFQAGGSPEG
ncbi:MAG: zinc-dependent peptidase [Planctomycetes bacterium]|nr:zinc-dependent peptidase [Planctomycetota bacterium]